jgi:hypothetical protein
MENTNFKPIFDYIDQKVDNLEIKLKTELASKQDIQRILNAIDSFAGQSKLREQEQIVLKAKTERIEHWVNDASKKVNVPYSV